MNFSFDPKYSPLSTDITSLSFPIFLHSKTNKQAIVWNNLSRKVITKRLQLRIIAASVPTRLKSKGFSTEWLTASEIELQPHPSYDM